MTDTQTPVEVASQEFDEDTFRLLQARVGACKADKLAAEQALRNAQRDACDYLLRVGGRVVFTDESGERQLARRRQDKQTTWHNVDELFKRLGEKHRDLFKIGVDSRALEKAAKKDPSILAKFIGHFTITDKSAWLEIVPAKDDGE